MSNDQRAISLDKPQDYFSRELKKVIHKLDIEATPEIILYLSGLLERSLDSSYFYESDEAGNKREPNLAVLYLKCLNSETLSQKLALYQRLGDVSLILSGYFPDSLLNKVVDIRYYYRMGTGAYSTVASLSDSNEDIFQELSSQFRSYSKVLLEMSLVSGIQNDKDLLKTYEKWLVTGSDTLREVLAKHGITIPVTVDSSKKQS